ncbi:MAG: hypothetical protein M1826_001750 [Phylliscum demangeonii]|nr:MAG: hypothetical protein M1826_001750 [Phylliscum demangeonii]
MSSRRTSMGRSTSGHRSASGPKAQKTLLAKALEQANSAVLLDNAHNLDGAVEAYADSCALLQEVMMRSSDEDRRKLDDVRKSYKNRIYELKNMPLHDVLRSKALPARPDPVPGTARGRVGPTSVPNNGRSSAMGDIVNTRRMPNGRHAVATPAHHLPPMQIPERRESLMPSGIREVEQFIFSKSPLPPTERDPWLSSNVPQGARLSSFNSQAMEREHMPPPLSPRRASSPVARQSGPATALVMEALPEPAEPHDPTARRHLRAESNGSTSWLDTIDESGASSASSFHSRSSSPRLHRNHVRAASGTTEAEFDAALDAAVEAAYNEGLGISESADADHEKLVSEARRNVELAKKMVREAEQEAEEEPSPVSPQARYDSSPSTHTNHHQTESLRPERPETEMEERPAQDVPNGFEQDFALHPQSQVTVPRQSDSSDISGRTWESSRGSIPTTAGTSLQTLAESPTESPMPEFALSNPSATSLAAPLTSPPPPPPPLGAPPLPPIMTDFTTQSVRGRRLSRRSHESLTIKVANRPAPDDGATSTKPPPIPLPIPSDPIPVPFHPQTASAEPLSPADSLRTPSVADITPKLSSPLSKVDLAGSSPGLLKIVHIEGGGTVPSASRTASPSYMSGHSPVDHRRVRKNLSASSLKNRNLSISSPDGSDLSPLTPTILTFSAATSTLRKATNPSTTAAPVSQAGYGFVAGAPVGGVRLFDHDFHFGTDAGTSNHVIPDPPLPLEPCPLETILRPFWLMRCMYQTIVHPRGGYISTRIFVPRDAWHVKGVKLKAVEEKVSNCDFLTAALLKLGNVDTCDADAVLDEMQSLEAVLDQIQSALSKKLGNDVGPQGAAAWIRDAPTGNDHSSSADVGYSGRANSTNKTYLSWKQRLRPKHSGISLTAAPLPTKDGHKDNAGMSSVPMTSTTSTRTGRRDITRAKFAGPNATYMSALARLFDAAQVLGERPQGSVANDQTNRVADQISRQVEDPGLKHSSATHVGLELSARHAAEFFAFYICRFALVDLSMMLDKFIKRGSEWVSV